MEHEVEPRGEDNAEDAESSVSPLEILAFVARAARRHLWLGISVGAVVLVVGIAVAFVLPLRFDSEARILANPSVAVAPALTPGGRPADSRDPFAGSSELLMQKPNLIRIAEKANLVGWFRTHRTFPQRAKDSVFALWSEPLSDQKLTVALAETLSAKMYTINNDKVLTIHVGWNDPDMAQTLARLAKDSYLEMRRNDELAVISASIAIIEDEVRRAAQGIDVALEDLMQMRDRARQAALGAAVSRAAAQGATVSARATGSAVKAGTGALAPGAPADTKLTARLAEVRQRTQEIEGPWRRRQAELKFQLTDLRGTYGPEHPIVIQQQAKIAEAERPPSELGVLRETERQLIAQLENAAKSSAAASAEGSSSMGGKATGSALPRTAPTIAGTARVIASGGGLLLAEKDDDPTIAPAKASLAAAIQRYSEVTKRLDSARLDLTSSQVALQYRFSVVGEPERPRGPSKPLRLIAMLGSIAGALVLGLLSGAVRDLLDGRVYEPWQVRSLGLPLIGTVNARGSSSS